MNNTDERNNLQEIITQALQEMKDEYGGQNKVNSTYRVKLPKF